MKNRNRILNSILTGVLCAALIAGLGCSAGRRDAGADVPEGTEVRVYEVFGMDCPGCHGGVEKLVNEIPAVEESRANWKEKHLTVTVRPGLDLEDEDVLAAIRRANLTPGKRVR